MDDGEIEVEDLTELTASGGELATTGASGGPSKRTKKLPKNNYRKNLPKICQITVGELRALAEEVREMKTMLAAHDQNPDSTHVF